MAGGLALHSKGNDWVLIIVFNINLYVEDALFFQSSQEARFYFLFIYLLSLLVQGKKRKGKNHNVVIQCSNMVARMNVGGVNNW